MSEEIIYGEWEERICPLTGALSEWRTWRKGDSFGVECRANLFSVPQELTDEKPKGVLRYVCQ